MFPPAEDSQVAANEPAPEANSAKGHNLCRHLKQAAINQSEDLAVAVQRRCGGKFSYQELDFKTLDSDSDRLASALLDYGFKPGMKAVLMVTPGIEFFVLTFALFKAGIIPVMVDPGMGIAKLKQCLAEAEPDAFIGIPKAHVARLLFGWGKPSIRLLLTAGEGFLGRNPPWGGSSVSRLLARAPESVTFPMAQLGAQQMAAILFTSGSTGTPKGVVYSHGMFEAQITALRNDYGIRPGERDLSTFPLFALFGPALGMASIVPEMDASKPITARSENLFAAIEHYACSNMFVNPALLDRLGRGGSGRRLHSLKRVISAGAPADPKAIARFSAMLAEDVEVLNSYGATESLPVSMIGSKALGTTSAITDKGGGICVGKPVSGIRVSIIGISEEAIDSWSPTLELATGEIGEIVVDGAVVNQSYYRREGANKQAKIAYEGRQLHRMGDLGYLDAEGRLWMCGRKAHRVDVIKDGELQKRYLSIPCERIFNTHPQVKRSALVGVELMQNKRGGGGTVQESAFSFTAGLDSTFLDSTFLDSTVPEKAPLICIELEQSLSPAEQQHLFTELQALADKQPLTRGIRHFMLHPGFPMDVRHNAKIFREQLAVWAQKQLDGNGWKPK
ncbi:fatty acid CoA ligase family protein [Shewanella algae]|uniref:fatty acid CoA ligase family protein n=1 Tax=Shewanella algae TaxID=38313 RepID=UPI001AADCCB1|nr:fatty acid CoA ligase family protein [Shewanella algae]MBO2615729.1 AMP-binding protein [Shewanella algae]